MSDYDRKSPLRGKIDSIRSKLPFLAQSQFMSTQHQMAMMNMDLYSVEPLVDSPNILRSTGQSFAERGLVLKEVNRHINYDELATPSATVDKAKLKKLLKST